jgi:hypothetical protein
MNKAASRPTTNAAIPNSMDCAIAAENGARSPGGNTPSESESAGIEGISAAKRAVINAPIAELPSTPPTWRSVL